MKKIEIRVSTFIENEDDVMLIDNQGMFTALMDDYKYPPELVTNNLVERIKPIIYKLLDELIKE